MDTEEKQQRETNFELRIHTSNIISPNGKYRYLPGH